MSHWHHPDQPGSHRFRGRTACVPLAVALLLLPAACGRTTTAATTPAATATGVTPGPQLAWQPLSSLPGPLDFTSAIAAGDGDVAYSCAAPGPGEAVARAYVTRDHGMDWTRTGDLPVGANPAPPTGTTKGLALACLLVVDANNPAMAIVRTIWTALGGYVDPSQVTTYATVDLGAHWRKLPASNALIFQMASRQGRVYAVRQGNASTPTHTLWASSDQMVTWQAIDNGIVGPARAFWLNPAGGALLAETNGEGTTSDQFYTSADGGARWTRLPAPQFDPHSQQWVVAAPQAGQAWHICAASAAPNTLACSSDGGQTWAARPALNLAASSPKTAGLSAPTDVFAIASDGAVLATVLVPEQIHIYRLPQGASVWQDLGPLPSPGSQDSRNYANPYYYPTSAGGVLWAGTQQGVQVASYP